MLYGIEVVCIHIDNVRIVEMFPKFSDVLLVHIEVTLLVFWGIANAFLSGQKGICLKGNIG